MTMYRKIVWEAAEGDWREVANPSGRPDTPSVPCAESLRLLE